MEDKQKAIEGRNKRSDRKKQKNLSEKGKKGSIHLKIYVMAIFVKKVGERQGERKGGREEEREKTKI